ncbi:MAG: DUF4159 domain-containing protein [Planctomycetales bacterium]|nr:DUF4159 domain-containing protein [Planctomycetales bacterium]
MVLSRQTFFSLVLVLLIAASSVLAMQYGRRGRGSGYDARSGVPMWEVDRNFDRDVFTFARVQYSDGYGYGRSGRGGWGRGGRWSTDYPDSDLNFSLRLQQLTSLKVNPEPVTVQLTDQTLFDYPFLYMIEPGNLLFSDEEVVALRKYCLNGGFMMVDDFWGEDEWLNFALEMKRVFPEKDPQDVPLEHEIFHCVYDLKEKPQVPSIHAFYGGGSYENRYGSDTSHANYRAIYDDAGRMMVFICHNTDLGDGWEREGENHEYFQEYAVKKSYPLGINIVTYAMSH